METDAVGNQKGTAKRGFAQSAIVSLDKAPIPFNGSYVARADASKPRILISRTLKAILTSQIKQQRNEVLHHSLPGHMEPLAVWKREVTQ